MKVKQNPKFAANLNKKEFKELCKNEDTIPIFCNDWWLNACAEGNWDVALVKNRGGEIIACLPYVINRRLGFTILSQPSLTQYLGPWIKPQNSKYSTRLANEKKILQELFEKLPRFDAYHQNWSYHRTNWLPLYWNGFQQTTRYTYRIENLKDLDKVWDSFQTSSRTDIKKAQNGYGLKITQDMPVELFWELNEKVFLRQGFQVPYSKEVFMRLDNALQIRNQRVILAAQDERGRVHAAIYLVWDKNSAYTILEASDPELRVSAANSLCKWEAIKYSATVTKSFDFEGSMIEDIERSYRRYGAIQTPYFSISKINSRTLRLRNALKGVFL